MSVRCVVLLVRSAAVPLQAGRGTDADADQTDVRSLNAERRSLADYYYNDDSHMLKRLQHDMDGDVEKRRFCRHNYVYNPVSGRCQASLLVSNSVISSAIRKSRPESANITTDF